MLSPGIPWMSAQVACHLQVCHEKDTIYYSSNFVMYRKIWCMKWIMEHIVIIKIGKFVNKKNLSFFFSFYTDSWIIIVTPLRTIDIYLQKKNIRHYWKTSFYMHVLAYTPKNCKCTNDFMITCVFHFFCNTVATYTN